MRGEPRSTVADGMSTPEIAAALGMPLSTVDMHMRNAIRLLWRERVNPHARTMLRGYRKRRAYVYKRTPNQTFTDAQIDTALAAANGNKTHAAKALGWTRQAINRRLRARAASAQSTPNPSTAPNRPRTRQASSPS